MQLLSLINLVLLLSQPFQTHLGINHQGKERGDQKHRKDSADDQATHDHAAQTPRRV